MLPLLAAVEAGLRCVCPEFESLRRAIDARVWRFSYKFFEFGAPGKIVRVLRTLIPRLRSGPPARWRAPASFGAAVQRLIELPTPWFVGSLKTSGDFVIQQLKCPALDD
jgi:hypothetical protein